MADRYTWIVLNKQPKTEFALSAKAADAYKQLTGKALPKAVNPADPNVVQVVRTLGSKEASGSVTKGKKKCWLVAAQIPNNVRYEIMSSNGIQFCALEERYPDDNASVIGMPPVKQDDAATDDTATV